MRINLEPVPAKRSSCIWYITYICATPIQWAWPLGTNILQRLNNHIQSALLIMLKPFQGIFSGWLQFVSVVWSPEYYAVSSIAVCDGQNLIWCLSVWHNKKLLKSKSTAAGKAILSLFLPCNPSSDLYAKYLFDLSMTWLFSVQGRFLLQLLSCLPLLVLLLQKTGTYEWRKLI